MSKLLVVFGATGNQGGSVANYVLQDPELSKQFKVRAVTRDPASGPSQSLANSGAEVVKGDVDDADSITAALKGAHTIFLPTVSVYDDQLRPRELRQGKTVADAAVAAGASYFIYSTLINTEAFTGGKIKHMQHFDTKYDVEQYIRGLPIKSAFFAPGTFMQNFVTHMAPKPLGDGTYALFNFVPTKATFPLIETAGDGGKYVGAVLAEPEKYEGKVFWAATELKSLDEVAEIMTKVTGKTVVYKQLPREQFQAFFPPAMGDPLCDMFQWIEEYGYYGPETEKRLEWTGQNVRGKLTTFEEFLRGSGFKLE